MKAGDWNDFFNLFDEDAWRWWFDFQELSQFQEFCEEVNEGEWDYFFDTLNEESKIAFVFAWGDDMWEVAKDTLNEEILEKIYELFEEYDDDEYVSFLWQFSSEDWDEMTNIFSD